MDALNEYFRHHTDEKQYYGMEQNEGAVGSNHPVLKVLKTQTINQRVRPTISKELAQHKKAVAPLLFREQRYAAQTKRPKFHLNPVQEKLRAKAKSLHPDYRYLKKLGMV